MIDGDDALPTLSAAIAALRIEASELPADELDHLYQAAPACTCPPDLVARGGFRFSCCAHGGQR